jgi:hypothetical protein
MKGFLFITLILFFAAGALHAQTPSANIRFEERVYNFGTIKEKNGRVSHSFVFENKGKTPVIIDDIHSACGCIGKVVSNDPVKPGAKGKVTITFDPGYKSGFFSKEIVVLSNNLQQFNRIWVEGVIEPMEHPVEENYPYNFGNGLYLRLKVMAFGYLAPGETKQMELHYANSTDKEMTLGFVADGKKDGLRLVSPGKIAPKAKGVIKVSYTMPATAGAETLLRIHPYVNNTKLKETLDIRVLNAFLGKGKGK